MSKEIEDETHLHNIISRIPTEAATSTRTLPAISQERYKIAYRKFTDWRFKNNIETLSENVMLTYFEELSDKLQMKPSSLWAFYSMLKPTIHMNQGVNIANYAELLAYLKKKNEGYRSKKSKVLTAEHINEFIKYAPDRKYLFMKVVVIIGISGACIKQELRNIQPKDIEDTGKSLIITISVMKTKRTRPFVVSEHFYPTIKKYMNIRSAIDDASNLPFFLNYANGKCSKQCAGLNKLGSVPKEIATYLRLPDANAYTGHCFRASPMPVLVDASSNLPDLNSVAEWESSMAADGEYGDDFQESSVTLFVDDLLDIKSEADWKSSTVSGRYDCPATIVGDSGDLPDIKSEVECKKSMVVEGSLATNIKSEVEWPSSTVSEECEDNDINSELNNLTKAAIENNKSSTVVSNKNVTMTYTSSRQSNDPPFVFNNCKVTINYISN